MDLAVQHHNSGRLPQAVTIYQQILQSNPEYAEAHSNLGLAFQIQGKLEEAIASYQTALSLKPDLAEGYLNLGNALKEKDEAPVEFTDYRRCGQPGRDESRSGTRDALR